MSTVAPDVIYKFREFNKNALSILLNKQIYYSRVEDLNDPFDCQLPLQQFLQKACDDETDENKKFICQNYLNLPTQRDEEGAQKNLHASLEETFKNVGVFSASGNIRDSLMWSHYGGNHKGFAIGFNSFLVILTLREDGNIIGAELVQYEERPSLGDILSMMATEHLHVMSKATKASDPTPFSKDMQEVNDRYFSRLATAALTTKSVAWQYEQEFRLLRSKPGLVSFKAVLVDSVVFGSRADDGDIAMVRSILEKEEYRHVKLKKAVKSPLSFELDIVDL